jgi:hypothetical protein
MFIVVTVAAVFGATLGLCLRRAVVALLAALVVVAVVQLGAMFLAHVLFHTPNQVDLAAAIENYAGEDLWALAPNLAASGFGALIASVMQALSMKDSAPGFSLPDSWSGSNAKARRNKIRFAQAVEERPNHIAAESRIDRLMKL